MVGCSTLSGAIVANRANQSQPSGVAARPATGDGVRQGAGQHLPYYEQSALADPLRGAAYRISLNIAEGCRDEGTRADRRVLDNCVGSLAEVQTALAIARDVGYLRPAELGRLEALAAETSRTLFDLLRKISSVATKPAQSR
jgi:four helix bundle protein